MTHDHCEEQLARMNILQGLPEDSCEYFAALQDVPDDRFTLAVTHAIRTRVWFPKPAELRADVDATAPSVALSPPEPKIEALAGGGHEFVLKNPCSDVELRIPVTRVWKFDCEDCADSGWRSQSCPKDTCGRRYDHDPHAWVDRCPCREWNPTIRRRQEALGAKYAKAPEKVGT